MAKSTQLQIRVSPQEKARLNAAAVKAGMSVSEWVLSQALPQAHATFEALVTELARNPDRASYTLAALNDLLTQLPARKLAAAVDHCPVGLSTTFHHAYVAAMVEHACERAHTRAPDWTRDVPALTEPYFASNLIALRALLLRSSPPAFRRRNMFIDSTLGDRV